MALTPRLVFFVVVPPVILLAQQNRLTGPIDDAHTVVLAHSVSHQAQAIFDEGVADPSLRIPFITLTMKPSAAQQAALEQLLGEQTDPSSPNYRRWLTPEQFGDRFGLSTADYAAVVSWLQGRHMHIEQVARARNWVAFSGTVRDVGLAFHTEIHRYLIDGLTHTSNTTEVHIPAALRDFAGGIRGLDDFSHSPPAAVTPLNTSASGVNALAPGDWAIIYDVAPLYAMGINGAGQRVGILGRSDLDQTYIDTFRSQFGLPPSVVEQHLIGPDPGVTNAASEAALDLEWADGIAPGATLVYVYAGTFVDAAQGAIDQNLATVLNESYGTCEPYTPESNRLMAQQANAEGITWVASSGDSGAADCDPHGFFNVTGNATTVSDGPAVGMPASFPEVTGVGGTEFNEGGGHYWSSTNSASGASALSYIPEVAWNDTGAGGLLASGGGASLYFSKPAWQVGPGVPADGARDVPDISFSASGNHDPYMVVNSNGFRSGGTSASAPSFAGVVALLNQYLVSTGALAKPGLGNVNPELYRLARTTTNVFHDITQGNNMVPCVAGSPGCVNGMLGFNAGPGYDQATGLGSIDIYNLVTQWNSPAAGTSTSLVASPSSVAFGGSLQLTATVSATSKNSAVPTGTVAFTTRQAFLGTAPLVNNAGATTATLNLTGPTLPAGTATTITATYSGDANFNSSAGSTSVSVGAGSGGSAVSVNITPNPAQAGQLITVSLTEEAGVGTTITGWTIDGTDEFSLFQQDFGGTGLPAFGTLSATILSTPVPGTRLYAFTGIDANGRTWSQQYTLILAGVFQASSLNNVGSAADGYIATLAPDSIAAAYGNNLAPATQNITTLPLPYIVEGSTLNVEDSTGNVVAAPIYYVSGDQINFVVPAGMASGPATVMVTTRDGTISQASTIIAPVSPAMFQLNAGGLAAAYVVDATTDTTSNVFQISGGQIVPSPIGIPASDNVSLELLCTGLRAAPQASVSVTIGTTNVPVTFAGAQATWPGLDEVNVQLPSSLTGSGDVVVQLTASGIAANPVHITIQ
jgi:uncharacterized protein (TIGR03437 family)